MIVLGTYFHFMINVTAGLFLSITSDPSLGFVKYVSVVAGFGGANADLRPSVNRATNCNNRPSGNMIWRFVSTYHDGSSSAMPVSSSNCLACSWCILLIFRWFVYCTHSMAIFRTASCASHSVVFPFAWVVTCCTSLNLAIPKFTADCFSLFLIGHWFL